MTVVAEPGDVTIKIVLADDHTMVRSALRRSLDAEHGLEVVAEAGDVEGALARTRDVLPQVVVLDLNMPGRASLPAIPELLEAAPGCAVVVLTMQSDLAFAREALSIGASGYVLKQAAEAGLVEAVRAAAAGRTYLDPGLGAQLASMGARPAPGRARERTAELLPGSTFAGHRIDAVAGRGGMGVVYRATDRALQRTVALKVLAPGAADDPQYRARFERECRLAAAIDHPNVVEIYHAGEEGGLLYATMRFVEGTDLRALLRGDGALAPTRAVSITTQVAAALDEAHSRGLIHRDVKPANILIAERPRAEHAFLTDFGITKRSGDDTELTRTGVIVGTVDYMAPEQAEGRGVDPRTDVYALGCVLYQALNGAVPFERDSELDKLYAHVHAPPPVRSLRPGVPDTFERVLARALAKDPAARQQSAGELAREAREALA